MGAGLMDAVRATITALAGDGDQAFQRLVDRGDLHEVERSMAFVEQLRDPLDRALR